MELTLTPMSTQRALRVLGGLAFCAAGKRPPSKVSGKGLQALLPASAASLYFLNRGMFPVRLPDGSVLGPDDEISAAGLARAGVRSLLVRCNADRDLVTLKLQAPE
jgi:hypothetical protein